MDYWTDSHWGRVALGAACLIGASMPVFAQQSAVTEKWRPKEGAYAAPGAKFDARCGEFGDMTVNLNDMDIKADEWVCKINKIVDTAPGAIRLSAVCNDYNRAVAIGDPDPDNRKFKETIELKKIDGMSMRVTVTSNGKLRGSWRASYCSAETQRLYIEANEKAKNEAAEKAKWEQKAVEERKAAEERAKANSQK